MTTWAEFARRGSRNLPPSLGTGWTVESVYQGDAPP